MKIWILLVAVCFTLQPGYGKTTSNIVKSEPLQKAIHLLPKDLQQPFPCVYAAREVKRLLNFNHTKDSIVGPISHICHLLPANTRYMCSTLVRNYLGKMIELLQDGGQVEQVCRLMPTVKSKRRLTFPSNANVTTPCGLCKYLVEIVEFELKNPSTVQDFLHTVETTVCDVLENTMLKQTCLTFVKNDLSGILKIISNLPPSVPCLLIFGVCNGHDGLKSLEMLNQINQLLPNRCILGPIYSCYNQQLAQQCDMQQYCLARSISKY